LHINLRGYGGIAKIEDKPPNSITEFWIYIVSRVTSFPLVILSGLPQPFIRAECSPDGSLGELREAAIKPIWPPL
jgi:hypothetical protein